jgi:flagellar hook-basal body complex protein FliE
MINPTSLTSISNITSSTSVARGSAEAPSGASFKDFLLDSIKEVNQMQVDADHAVETLMTGGDADPAEVLTAVQKADLAFRMMMQMRNKLLEVYQQVQDVRI